MIDSISNPSWNEGHAAALRGDDETQAKSGENVDNFEFDLGFGCGTYDLNNLAAQIRGGLPTPSEAAERIGVPLELWPGNCFGIADLLCKKGVIRGRAVYGKYSGPIAPGTMFAGRPVVRHGWISTICEDAAFKGVEFVIDPTAYVFNDGVPAWYVAHRSSRLMSVYDEGSNRFTSALARPFPEAEAGKRTIPLPEHPARALHQFSGHRLSVVTLAQANWLANQPYDEYPEGPGGVYSWLTSIDETALIPYDNRQRWLSTALAPQMDG